MNNGQETFLAIILDHVKQDLINGFDKNAKVDFDICKTGLQRYENEDGSTTHYDTGSRKITITIDCPHQIITD